MYGKHQKYISILVLQLAKKRPPAIHRLRVIYYSDCMVTRISAWRKAVRVTRLTTLLVVAAYIACCCCVVSPLLCGVAAAV